MGFSEWYQENVAVPWEKNVAEPWRNNVVTPVGNWTNTHVTEPVKQAVAPIINYLSPNNTSGGDGGNAGGNTGNQAASPPPPRVLTEAERHAEWNAGYSDLIARVGDCESIEARSSFVKNHQEELARYKDSKLPVDDHLKYLCVTIDGQILPNKNGQLLTGEEAWKYNYDQLTEKIAKCDSMDKRVDLVKSHQEELAEYKKSGFNVKNDLEYLGVNMQGQVLTGNDNNNSNASSEAAWKARYDNIMQDIANSPTVDKRWERAYYYRNELNSMRESGLPVDDNLNTLGVKIEQKDHPTKVSDFLNQNKTIADTIKNHEILDEVINHSDKIKVGEVIKGAVGMAGGAGEAATGAGYVVGTDGVGAVCGGGYMIADGYGKIVDGSSKIKDGLRGLDKSNGGSQTGNIVENKIKEIAPKEGMLRGENIYDATQLAVGGVGLKKGIETFSSKVIERVPAAVKWGNTTLTGVGEEIKPLAALYNGGTIISGFKKQIETAIDMTKSKPTEQKQMIDTKSLLDNFAKNELSSGQIANQQQGSKGISR